MIEASPDTLQELHRIREQITQDYQGLSAHDFVERLHREVEAFLKERKIALKRVPPPFQIGAVIFKSLSSVPRATSKTHTTQAFMFMPLVPAM